MATCPVRLDNEDAYRRVNTLFRDLEAEGQAHLKADGFGDDQIRIKRSLDMRYVGQVHECTVEVDNFEIGAETVERLKDAFHRRHEQLYTYAEPNNTVEIVNIESTLYGLVAKPGDKALAKGGNVDTSLKGTRQAIFSADGKRRRVPVHDGARLGAGDVVTGLTIIEETTTTIVIEPGWRAELHESESYVVTRG